MTSNADLPAWICRVCAVYGHLIVALLVAGLIGVLVWLS